MLRFFVRDTGIGIEPDQIVGSSSRLSRLTRPRRGCSAHRSGPGHQPAACRVNGRRDQRVSTSGKGSVSFLSSRCLTSRMWRTHGVRSSAMGDGSDCRRQSNQSQLLELVTLAKQMQPTLADPAEAGLQTPDDCGRRENHLSWCCPMFTCRRSTASRLLNGFERMLVRCLSDVGQRTGRSPAISVAGWRRNG